MSSEHGHDPQKAHDAEDPRVTLPKKLIVCCDGTWMNSDNGWVSGGLFSQGYAQTPTNVTRIARAISSEDDGHHPQIVYYQAGIGTGIGITDRILGGGTGLGLGENIREAYAFLVNNYRVNDPDHLIPPDAIFLVGFSRGAFTARSIAGLLGAIGLLKKRAMPHFYEAFSDWAHAGSTDYKPLFFDRYFAQNKDVPKVQPPLQLAHDKTRIDEYMREYRRILLTLNLTQEVEIKCIGVWDTVGALGVPVNPILQNIFPFLPSFVHEYQWFDTNLDQRIKNAFQALALDEHRFPFSPTLWEKPDHCPTNLKQTWFPGAHSNVGGSYPDAGIADITLAWMMDQLAGHTTPHPKGFVHHDWIKFDDDYIDQWYDSDVEWLAEHREEAYRGWAMGHVYDSNTFPQSLAGARTRCPGRYHRTFYDSGKPDPAHFLHNTHEHLHASVRVRVDQGGRPVEPDPSQKGFPYNFGAWLASLVHRPRTLYTPQRPDGPLHGWSLLDHGHSGSKSNGATAAAAAAAPPQTPAGNHVSWRWGGNKEACAPTNFDLPEDILGPYERKLLEKDPRIAAKVIASNSGGNIAAAEGTVGTDTQAEIQAKARHAKSFPLQ